jgi:hypothetical protein
VSRSQQRHRKFETLARIARLRCGWCDGRVSASRSDARYCSNACRQAAYRERLK